MKKYEGQLCKRLKIVDDEDLDIKSDFGSNNLLLQQMISVLKKNKSRFSIPLSRNDKNSGVNSLNKNKNEKSSIREKLLSKGYRSRHIFDDDDDEDKNEKENNEVNSNANKEEKNENEEENDKMYNDTNYWELKNDLPDKIKKEVDKKTNIIFNYNPITGENDKKSEITEEDELLSIAMGLEQNEKMEKSKKIDIIPNNETENNINSNTNQSNVNNNKFHYSVKNFNDKKNNYDNSKYINHRTKNEDKILKETSNQKLLSEIKELDYIENNDNVIIEGNKSNSIKKDVIIGKQKLRKTQNNPSSIVNNDMKNSYQKDFKNKRYYGYDDRHNLEGTINNHTIYVSVYTKKENKNN